MADGVTPAENEGSIPVARSKLDFVATTVKVVVQTTVGFRQCSPLFARHLIRGRIRHFRMSREVATIFELKWNQSLKNLSKRGAAPCYYYLHVYAGTK